MGPCTSSPYPQLWCPNTISQYRICSYSGSWLVSFKCVLFLTPHGWDWSPWVPRFPQSHVGWTCVVWGAKNIRREPSFFQLSLCWPSVLHPHTMPCKPWMRHDAYPSFWVHLYRHAHPHHSQGTEVYYPVCILVHLQFWITEFGSVFVFYWADNIHSLFLLSHFIWVGVWAWNFGSFCDTT